MLILCSNLEGFVLDETSSMFPTNKLCQILYTECIIKIISNGIDFKYLNLIQFWEKSSIEKNNEGLKFLNYD